jgi:hypothetical protein
MSSTYGRKTGLGTTGNPIEVIADGRTDGFKAGGVTVDWSLITAVAAETTLSDGTVVAIGDKYIRYGTILDLVGTAEVQAIDLSAGDDPTAGTWTITYSGQTTSALAWNASAAAVQAALEALSNIDVGDVVVTKSGFVYTLTFAGSLGNVAAVTIGSGSLTGATSVTVTTSTAGAGTGLYGPADTSASDGRQTLARGESFIVNRTVKESELGSAHVPCFDRGTIFKNRLVVNEQVGGVNAPTYANFLTAFPGIQINAE